MSTPFNCSFIKQILDNKMILVSVGSGMGVLEAELENYEIQVICVDPTDTQTDRYCENIKMIKPPNYRNVIELIKAMPNIVGECQLLLNYPLSDYAIYDIAAIYDLRPKHIIVSCGYTGFSGSWLLHRFLRFSGVKTIAKLQMDESTKCIIGNLRIIKDIYKQSYYNMISQYDKIYILVRLDLVKSNGIPNTLFLSPEHEERVLLDDENVRNMCTNSINLLKNHGF